MAKLMKNELISANDSIALEGVTQGARRATGDATSSAPPNPEVVAIARRRQFSGSEKRRILALADRCAEPGDVGALLRREGIYSSQLATWRKQRASSGGAGLASRKRGCKADPAVAESHRTAKLTRENERLRRHLAQARLIIDVQKKVSSLIALQIADEDGESAWTA